MALIWFALSLSACQEIQIDVYLPDAGTSMPTTAPAADSAATQEAASAALFDPYDYYFDESDLPQDVSFVADNEKTLFVSYLQNPGTLHGIAHVREYKSYDAQIFVAQDIIQSPIPGEPEMLRTGHHGDLFVDTPPDMSLGDYSLILHMQSDTENNYSYRFYKNNMIVIVDLSGFNPFVTEENVYRLAKTIYDKLPEEFPVAEQIETPSLELQPELMDKYFYTLEMTTCQPPYEVTDPVVETELGYCFRADVLSLIRNLKVGLYDEHYKKVIYMKEFLYMPPMGEWDTGFFFPVWGYSWQHLRAGQYRALFWVDDQLAASLPITYVKQPQ
ncbi:MAG: hypothetical protein PWQ55_760 [Chloroflexota bacterium]|nr:hypothetical protein [Chloroflexota bacterium]